MAAQQQQQHIVRHCGTPVLGELGRPWCVLWGLIWLWCPVDPGPSILGWNNPVFSWDGTTGFVGLAQRPHSNCMHTHILWQCGPAQGLQAATFAYAHTRTRAAAGGRTCLPSRVCTNRCSQSVGRPPAVTGPGVCHRHTVRCMSALPDVLSCLALCLNCKKPRRMLYVKQRGIGCTSMSHELGYKESLSLLCVTLRLATRHLLHHCGFGR